METNNTNIGKEKTLPHGTIKTVAEKTGVSEKTVRNVLNGESENLNVMKAVIDYVENFNQVKLKFTEIVNQ